MGLTAIHDEFLVGPIEEEPVRVATGTSERLFPCLPRRQDEGFRGLPVCRANSTDLLWESPLQATPFAGLGQHVWNGSGGGIGVNLGGGRRLVAPCTDR